MGEARGEFARVRSAFDQPTLTLLHRQTARFTVTAFRCCFSREVSAIPVARMHQMVDNLLDDLRADGTPGVPDGTGRSVCQAWVKGLWLTRDPTTDGEELYSLTSHAQAALTLVDGLSRERSTLSEHRISTIVNAVRRFNAEANPSKVERIRLLDQEIARLAVERDRLAAGGDVAPVRAEYMLEGYAEVLDLIQALPSDFKRVQEAFETLRRQILDAFRAEDQHAGAVIDTYLQRADDLMSATAEGRAFEGAFGLLRNESLLLQLRQDLDALLEHPMAQDILQDTDRRELRSTLTFIRRGIEEVLAQRARATKAIKDYIQTHDAARDRELASTLRDLDQELSRWLERTGPRTKVPLALLPETHNFEYLPRRFHDPAPQIPPAPLEDQPAADDEESRLADMLAWGGPSLPALRQALASARITGQSLGELFSGLGPDLARPVEVFGLLHLAEDSDDLVAHPTHTEDYRTVRPDGTTRTLRAARIAPAATFTRDSEPT